MQKLKKCWGAFAAFLFFYPAYPARTQICNGTGQKSHKNDVGTLKQEKTAANAPQQNFKQKMKNPKIREIFFGGSRFVTNHEKRLKFHVFLNFVIDGHAARKINFFNRKRESVRSFCTRF